MRFVLALLIVALALLASGLEEAKKLYRQKAYKKAYVVLKKEYLHHLQEPLYQFYLGLCAQELGKYGEAAAAFERVLLIDPKNVRTRLELARTYYLLNRYDESIQLFRELLHYKLPQSVQEKIYHYLALMESKEYSLEAMVSLAIGYDSNVLNSTDMDRYKIPKFNIEFNNTIEKVSDLTHKEYLFVQSIKRYDESLLKLEGTFYFKTHRRYGSQNFAYAKITPSIIYGDTEYGLLYEKLYYGSNPYLYNIGGYVRHFFDEDSRVELKAWREFDQGEVNRNKDAKIFEILYANSLQTPWALHYYEVAFRKKMRLYRDQTDVSYNQWRLFVESRLRRLGLGVEYDRTAYNSLDPFFFSKRRDNYYNVYLYYLFPLQNYYLKTIIGYIYNDSNHAAYRYHKVYFDLEIGGNIR